MNNIKNIIKTIKNEIHAMAYSIQQNDGDYNVNYEDIKECMELLKEVKKYSSKLQDILYMRPQKPYSKENWEELKRQLGIKD